MNVFRLFTTFSGRITRLAYWLGFATIVAFFGLGRYFIKELLEANAQNQTDKVVLLWSVLAVIPLTALSVKRFHDRDRPSVFGYATGATIFLSMVAPQFGDLSEFAHASWPERIVSGLLLAVSLFALVENGFLRGTRGPNRYGPGAASGNTRALWREPRP